MNKPKILIVEDESIVALDMKRILEKCDFDVTDTATSYETAISSVQSDRPDLILMDICLNNSIDGIETTRKIKSEFEIPVIYITALADDITINRAIQTNPVSYLVKPFNKDELKSNILLGLYKSNDKEVHIINSQYVNLGLNYFYDYSARKLYYKKEVVKLSKKEDLLLKILIDANGDTVTFEDLEYKIWSNISVSSSTLRTLIYRLRMKLDYELIESIPMIGCRLIYLDN